MKDYKIEMYILGQSISKMGDRIYSFILPVLYSYYFVNPYSATIISGSYSIGGILGSSLGIKLSDKLNYKKWSLYLNIIQALVVLEMTFLLNYKYTLVYLYGFMSLLLGISLSFFQPFNGKYIYSLGTEEMVKKITSIKIAGENFGVAIGAILSGVIISYKLFSLATFINSVTFFISAIFIYYINRINSFKEECIEDKNKNFVKKNEKKNFLTNFLLMLNFFICIFTQPSIYLITSNLIYKSQEWKISYIISANGIISAIFGYLLFKFEKIKVVNEINIFFSWVIFSIGILSINYIEYKGYLIGVGGIWAITQSLYLVALESMLVKSTDELQQGKMFSKLRLTRQLSNPIGFAFANYLVTTFQGTIALKYWMYMLVGISVFFWLFYLFCKKNILKNIGEEKIFF